ncbi:MAG: ATP-binding protein [Acidobacteriota bacterium]
MIHALSSLTNRIFVASTLLATVAIGSAVFFVSSRLEQQAEAELGRDLTEAVRLVDQQRATQFDTLTRTARLIADLPKFKAAIETHDEPTVRPIAQDYHRQAGSDVFIVRDDRGRLLASIGTTASLAHGSDAKGEVPGAEGAPAAWALGPDAAGVLQVVTVPVTIGLNRPEALGTLTVGSLLDDGWAASFKAQSGADLAIAFGGRIRASTLDRSADAQLASLLGATTIRRTTIEAIEYAAVVTPLDAISGPPGANGEVPLALVLRSRTERMRTLSAIQTGLGGVAAVTIVLAALVSYAVARTMTRPLAAITIHMREVATTGDLTRKIRVSDADGWHDEDARLLASTFNTLTDSIARFQREATQRERLSSLGRMSTIVAHEIRNPLMIIKGALRQMSREGASAVDVQEAAQDIDGETNRLDRIVEEVLDFARPIRFDRSPTDVNAVCQDAVDAMAAATGGAAPRIEAHLDPSLGSIETDGERLRTALINLLTNARQAVLEGNGHGPGARASVALVTTPADEGRVGIDIKDRGAGIRPENLPHIFDPYFTTRRTGTGLGLPIAKNIVDGLGGSLTVASTPGEGTTIHIELGDAPSPR